MSYSFSITGGNKAEAIANIDSELGKVISGQSIHAADRQQAMDAAEAFVNILKEPGEGEFISISMHGSLSWRDNDVFTGASVSVSAYISVKI
jgi:hypothetical protein